MEKTHASLSRRTFLTGAVTAGAVAAMGGLAGCSSPKSKSSDTSASKSGSGSTGSDQSWLGSAPQISDADCSEVLSVDVVVVGAGTGGYFAAGTSAENGMKTLLIEKSGAGDGIRSSALGAINSKAQQAQGVKIDKTSIVNDIDRYGDGHVNVPLINQWANNSGEAIDWYTDILAKNGIDVQLEWNMPEGTFYTDWPTGHGTNGGSYTDREPKVAKIMDAYITSFPGCEERFHTPMQKLIVEDGKVVGLYAKDEDKGSYIRINASKGVIVATGGYAFNEDMYAARQSTRMSGLGTFGGFPTCTGDGIKALMWIGAQIDDVPTSLSFNRCLLRSDQQLGDPFSTGDDFGYFFYSSQPFLRVDNEGNRFHNESAPYDYVLSASSRRPEGDRFWHQIWDANWKDDVTRFHTVGCSTLVYREGADHDAIPGGLDSYVEPEMEEFVEAGFIQKANTLDELADKMGIADKKNFLATCETQNKNYDAQSDPEFGKEAFRLSALKTPPFYGTTRSSGLTLCTLDGIKTNATYQPYGDDGSVIDGVYVIGNDCGGFYAGTYPNTAAGLNAGRCATGGRQVAKMLATK
ncbi:MAG: FAD-binding protein [Eggerthellaceae bacterium]|jgi:hypothetical protein|nr:FAD-binding protein [Eggerthellaceae bacterium]MCH4221510.1 FAD-binding protein [Eggerthellaceae bacterium]